MMQWIRSGQLGALVILIAALPVLLHLLTHPALLRRRLRTNLSEPDPGQRIIAGLALLCALALVVVSVDSGNIDDMLGLSLAVPVLIMLLGDLFIASGLVVVWLTFRANSYAAATVNVEPGQTVVSTGPYALVRHPLYSGGAVLVLGLPLALGSWWGLVLSVLLIIVLIMRLLREERYLSVHLSGYDDYRTRVTYRLVPLIW